MMVSKFLFFLFLISINAHAGNVCDIRPGISLGVDVVEFVQGRLILSKIPFTESTPVAIHEEMVSLQDMSLCDDKIKSQRCVLKFEKKHSSSLITLYRGSDKWKSWNLNSKERAQLFVKGMKKFGLCL